MEAARSRSSRPVAPDARPDNPGPHGRPLLLPSREDEPSRPVTIRSVRSGRIAERSQHAGGRNPRERCPASDLSRDARIRVGISESRRRALEEVRVYSAREETPKLTRRDPLRRRLRRSCSTAPCFRVTRDVPRSTSSVAPAIARTPLRGGVDPPLFDASNASPTTCARGPSDHLVR